MSTDHNTHIGIILTIPIKIEVQEVPDGMQCSKCKTRGPDPFCPTCGAPRKEVMVKKKVTISPQDIAEENGWEMYEWGYCPEGQMDDKNEVWLVDAITSLDEYGDYILKPDFSVQGEIDKFLNKGRNKRRIEILEKVFGPIKVEFGIVNYLS